jgi:hypothetical protein
MPQGHKKIKEEDTIEAKSKVLQNNCPYSKGYQFYAVVIAVRMRIRTA